MCRQFPGRLPSEIDNEPLQPMLRTVETWQATDAWIKMRQASREGVSWDTLHGQPMVDEMISVFAETMAEIRAARQRKAEAHVEEQETE
jgi:hypothetical protein